ncbi:MAG: hypothetical protein PCFJNLEI_01193 [Verrucomicrobiae bacterium]|nr:hypothetical protein [Verrucomicrobiae bacterium]
MVKTTQHIILQIEPFHSVEDTTLLRRKLLSITGVLHVHGVPGTHSVSITHDPVRAPVELILWAIRNTGRQATVLHRADSRQHWRWMAVATATLGVLVLLCHWWGVPRWVEAVALLALFMTGGWLFASATTTNQINQEGVSCEPS